MRTYNFPFPHLLRLFKLFAAIVLLAHNPIQTNSQELQKVAPLSPEAASLAKYGEVPISQFTGLADIRIPLYKVVSRELTLPIDLSYHPGGNKVEDIPSWVGLGWNLGSFPMVSRKVEGLPDELGYYHKFQGKTVDEIAGPNSTYEASQFWLFINSIEQGNADGDPDVFQASLLSKSFKFFWNQKENKFNTLPRVNVIIEWTGGGFRIVDDNGDVYQFYETETSMTSGSQPSPQIVTSWKVGRIFNGNYTDSLIFTYRGEVNAIRNLVPQIKCVQGNCPPSNSSFISNTTLFTKLPYRIDFAGGKVEFEPYTELREDLIGGYPLRNIIVSSSNEIVKRFEMSFRYLSGDHSGICSTSTSQERKRLMLVDVLEKSNDNLVVGQRHQMIYQDTTNIPCRLSMSQDYWGYYNGTLNSDLVPTVTVSLMNAQQIPIPGANRDVNPLYTQFATLKKIIYPTGGELEFTYENNQVATQTNVTEQFMAALEGEAEPTTNTYVNYFSINSNTGGATINVMIGELGADPTTCCGAILSIRGTDATNSHISLNVYNNFSYYVPNGNYEMKAIFNQNPPAYQSFFFIVFWEVPVNSIQNVFAGGLRTKGQILRDGTGKTITKRYRYVDAISGTLSSGKLFTLPYFSATESHTINLASPYNYGFFTWAMARPGATAVVHAGSPVGYRSVFEYFEDSLLSGVTQYRFSDMSDIDYLISPYPPSESYETFRGQLIERSIFKYVGGTLVPTQKITNEYNYSVFDEDESVGYRVKIVLGSVPPISFIPTIVARPYRYLPMWSNVSRTVTETYSSSASGESIIVAKEYSYHPSLYLPYSMQAIDSRGKLRMTRQWYPIDLQLSGSDEMARQLLVTKNMINNVLKEANYVDSILQDEQQTAFRLNNTNQVLPASVSKKRLNGPLENRIEFTAYSTGGRLISQRKSSDYTYSYIWDDLNKDPICEATNASADEIGFSSFELGAIGNLSGIQSNNIVVGGITGSRQYSSNNLNLVKNGLDAGKTYLVSYWTTGGALNVPGSMSGYPKMFNEKSISGTTWRQYVHKVLGQSQASIIGSGSIDEVRIYPEIARMKTFVNRMLVGPTSVCDENDQILYYEYDNFNRLKIIRDADGNVLKVFEYRYFNQ